MEIFHSDMSTFNIEDCLFALNADERLHADRLAENMKRRFIVSRYLRRRILGQDIEILTEDNGRPYIKGDSLFFSMSHTRNIFVMAVDLYPVGIDIELIKTRDFTKLSSWFFGEKISDCDVFYKRWTRYEAELKLAGQPLFSKEIPEAKHIHSQTLGECMLSVASNNQIMLPLKLSTL